MREFPRNGHAYVILAELELDKSNRPEALKLLQSAIERDPRSVTGHLMLANIHAGEKDNAKALTYLRQAAAIKPNDAHIIARIAELEKGPGGKPATAAVAASSAGKPAAPSAEPLVPFAGPMTMAVKSAAGPAAGASRSGSLDALCAEPGVRGALVADMHGRVVVAKNLASGQDELLAALSAEIVRSSLACQTVLGAERLTTWALSAGAGQALAFQRDRAFSVVVLADPSVRPAMLELRARQTLIDLGAA
jgi:predicted regulator of Ras-like GTPase activity (Roadblock/LC7/MglB family)